MSKSMFFTLLLSLNLSLSSSCNDRVISKAGDFDLKPYIMALQYLGIDTSIVIGNDSLISNATVKEIDFNNNVAPSDKKSIPAWIVTIDSVDFRSAANVEWGVEDIRRKNVSFIINRNSGQLLQVYTEPVHGVNGIENSIKKEWIDQILDAQIGKIVGLPDSIPKIGLLPAVFSGVGCGCQKAGQIVAYLVDCSERDNPAKPVWILMTTGLTGDEMFYRGTEEERSERKYSYFCLVDATIGKWKTMTGFRTDDL